MESLKLNSEALVLLSSGVRSERFCQNSTETIFSDIQTVVERR